MATQADDHAGRRLSRADRVNRLLNPKSIAVIGGHEAGEVITQCRSLGYPGTLWAVNPKRTALSGVPTVARIADLPEPPDAAFIAVNGRASIKAIEDLREIGCAGAVCYAAGFAEIGGGGGDLQSELMAAAGDMPFLGPNCYGLLNYLDRVALWPDVHGGTALDSGVAIISQSGNIAINMTMQRRALPIATVVTLGNQACIGVTEVLEALLDDPRITAIGLHIEGLSDLRRFSRAALSALARRVPIVALKIGRSETGARTALSHTSTLAGPDRLYDALFKRLGIHRADGITGFLEALKAMHFIGPIPSPAIATISCSGGEAGLMADIGARLGLAFPPLDDAQITALRSVLKSNEALGNPLDYHTYIWGDEPAMRRCFSAVMRGRAEVTVMAYDFPRDGFDPHGQWMAGFKAFAAATDETGARTAIVSNLPENQPDWASAAMCEAGVAPLQGLEDGLAALRACAEIGMAQDRPPAEPLSAGSSSVGGSGASLSEAEAKRALAAAGLSVPPGRIAPIDDAGRVARALGFPVVLKANDPGLAHKSESGAVSLGLADEAAVQAAADDLSRFGDTVLIERMVTGAVAELIVGIMRDPQFGLYLTIGAGGVLVELLQDSAVLLLPASNDAIRDALSGLRIAKLLEGWRGGPEADLDALVDAVRSVVAYAESQGDRLLELDVNPLLVLAKGQGAVAVDALIRVREGDDE